MVRVERGGFLDYMFGKGSKIALRAILGEMKRISGIQDLSSTSFEAAVKELEMLSGWGFV